MFESLLAKSGYQTQVIDVDKRMGMHMAMLHAPDASELALEDAVAQTNKMFVRKDEGDTITIENAETALVTVRVSEVSDFAHLN